jgi:hypothetical protein
MVRFRRRVIALLLPLATVAVLIAAASLWMEQQSARARLAEAQLEPILARATVAEGRAIRAEASLTAIGAQRQAEAAATAAAVARVAEPQRAVERALGRLFGVYQDPTGSGYEQLADVFSPQALSAVRAEADHLRGTARKLGGESTFTVDASAPVRLDADRVEVQTVERWVYDERDGADQQQRCFIEDSDQTYILRRGPGDSWLVDEIQFGGNRRSNCP